MPPTTTPSEMENGLEGEDRISMLPHDILLTILSQLEIKEAAKTSILSKTWRYLWTYWTDFDFAYSKIHPGFELYADPNLVEVKKLFNWVSQVVRLHSGRSITKFKVQFPYCESLEHYIDRWVNFALSKRVKILELNMLRLCHTKYTLKPSLLETDISFLTYLSLTDVDVTGDLLESLLSKCHLLEHLFVELSSALVRLKVVSLKLKHLSIRLCVCLEQLEIDAVNLSYLDYFGDATIIFKSLPSSLVEVTLEGQYCGATVPICQEIACFASQLFKFCLRIMLRGPLKEFVHFAICNIPAKGLPCFSNLKFLELTHSLESIVDIPSVTRLLGACPLLCEFKMQVCWDYPKPIPEEAKVFQGLEPVSFGWGECDFYIYDHNMAEDKIEYKPLPCLRDFEFVGFCGGDDDVNLILIILDMATQLQTFICHPIMPNPSFYITEDMGHVFRSRATKLESLVAHRVHNYVVLNDYDVVNFL